MYGYFIIVCWSLQPHLVPCQQYLVVVSKKIYNWFIVSLKKDIHEFACFLFIWNAQTFSLSSSLQHSTIQSSTQHSFFASPGWEQVKNGFQFLPYNDNPLNGRLTYWVWPICHIMNLMNCICKQICKRPSCLSVCLCVCVCVDLCVCSASGRTGPKSGWPELPGQDGAPAGPAAWGGDGDGQAGEESHPCGQQQCSGAASSSLP